MPQSVSERLTLQELSKGRGSGRSAVAFQPYWWDASPRRQRNETALPNDCDVAIVGSGFTGLSAALTLLDKGRSVVVLERDVPGFGASTRNGGQVGSGNQKFQVKRLIALRGERKATELLLEGTAMLAFIEELVTLEKIDCHFRRCGRFRAAIRPEHYEAMARDMEDLKRVAGVESFMVPRAEQLSEIGSEIFHGGSVLPHDASLQPALYHSGLMDRVEERGGTVAGHAGARAIRREPNGFLLDTERGQLAARNVLIATNGYTGALLPALRRRLVTVGSGLIATEEIPAELMSRLLPKNRVYGNTNRVFYYFRAAPDQNRIIWGGRAGRLGSSRSLRAYRHLARDLLSVFPDLGNVAVTHAWDGTIGYTHDELPHLGCMADGIHYAVGYCGTGVSRATYFGHKIALQIVGDPAGRTAFDDLTFPAFPVHPIAERTVPLIECWYRFRDLTKL